MSFSEFIKKKTETPPVVRSVLLKDIIDLNQWQMIQDHFSEVVGVSLRTVDVEGKPITKPSMPARLCSEVMTESVLGLQRCARDLTPFLSGAPQPKCLPAFIPEGRYSDDIETFKCHVGLTNFVIPVSITPDARVGYLIAGPVIVGSREDQSHFVGMAVEMGVSVDDLMDSMREIKLFSYSGIESVMQLLKDVSHYIAQLGYQKIKLKTIIPSSGQVDTTINAFYQDKLFGTLLEAASLAMNADVGSVMLINPGTGELYIKLAKGLEKDIIDKVKIKPGESLAGIAFKEKRTLFISDEMKDERIRQRLNRPELKSAMIVPIKPDNSRDIYGVINIGTHRSENPLTKEKALLIEQLVNLAGIALSRLGISRVA